MSSEAEITAVSPDTIASIAREVFGSAARVLSARLHRHRREGEVLRTPGPSRNLVYVVEVEGVPGRLAFRFSRGRGVDRYVQEAAHYRLLAERTGVRVPEVYRVDRSRALAPTPYMVMDYLSGEYWRYLVHPETAVTGPEEKAAIQRETGRFYARVHDISHRTDDPGAEAQTLLRMIDRLEGGVEAGHIDLDRSRIARCRRAVEAEPAFRTRRLSLCLADTEIYFHRPGARWEISFVCDPEWVEFRDPYSDLIHALTGGQDLWELTRPLEADPAEAAELPFFRGYAEVRPVDFAKLARVPLYHQLGLWGNLLAEKSPPEKKEWIRATRGAMIRELVDRVAALAPGEAEAAD